MTPQQIQYIIALAEEGNFSAAAKKLFVTQPSISQLIKNLEIQIGAPLFDRTKTPIRLTSVGQAYYEAAKKIEAIHRELDNRISEINDLQTGTLTIGTTPFRASCMLPKSIAYFNEQYPGIKITIVSDHIENLEQYLANGEIDICIDNDIFPKQLFSTEDLSTETYYLSVPKNSLWNQGREQYVLSVEDILNDSDALYSENLISSEEIKELSFILLDEKNESLDISPEIFRKLNVQPEVSLFATNIETRFHWINAGLGAGFIPDTLMKFGNFNEHPNYYKIKEPQNQFGLFQEKIIVAYDKNHFLTKVAKEYILQLKKLIGMGTWLFTT